MDSINFVDFLMKNRWFIFFAYLSNYIYLVQLVVYFKKIIAKNITCRSKDLSSSHGFQAQGISADRPLFDNLHNKDVSYQDTPFLSECLKAYNESKVRSFFSKLLNKKTPYANPFDDPLYNPLKGICNDSSVFNCHKENVYIFAEQESTNEELCTFSELYGPNFYEDSFTFDDMFVQDFDEVDIT